MNGSGNKNKYLKEGILSLCGMFLCCVMLFVITGILFPAGDTQGFARGAFSADEAARAKRPVVAVSEGLSATLSDGNVSGGTPGVFTDSLFGGLRWAPGDIYTQEFTVCNTGSVPFSCGLTVNAVSDAEDYAIPDGFLIKLDGDIVFEGKLNEFNWNMLTRSGIQLQSGETMKFSFSLSLDDSAKGPCGFSLFRLILSADDGDGNTVCSFTGDVLDYIHYTPAGSVLLLGDTVYTYNLWDNTVPSSLKFSGGTDTTVILIDRYADDGLVVYVRDSAFTDVNLYLPTACVFDSCEFRTSGYMNINADVLAHFNSCCFDDGVTVYVPNQEAGNFLEFTGCENVPVVVKR